MAGAAMSVAVWTIACGMSGPAGPVVHEHHAVERGAATSAHVEIDMSAGDLAVKPGAKTLFEGVRKLLPGLSAKRRKPKETSSGARPSPRAHP